MSVDWQETWRKSHQMWQDWACELLHDLALQPQGGELGDMEAMAAIRNALLPPAGLPQGDLHPWLERVDEYTSRLRLMATRGEEWTGDLPHVDAQRIFDELNALVGEIGELRGKLELCRTHSGQMMKILS